LLIQPTQWKVREGSKLEAHRLPKRWQRKRYGWLNHYFWVNHMLVNKNANLVEIMQSEHPYTANQCTPQQVEWAKENREELGLNRAITVWEVQ